MNDYTMNPYDSFKIKEIKRCVKDPIYFIKNYVYIQNPVKGVTFFDLYKDQCDLINTYTDNRFVIASMPRQTGKTACTAAYLLWKAMFTPDSIIMVCSFNLTNTIEILDRLRFAYENLPDFLSAGVDIYNKGTIVFDNGSRIIARSVTEHAGRGLVLSLLYLDEYAFVRPRVSREFWDSIAPTLVYGGECIITSTPNPKTNQFSKILKDANNIQPNGLGINEFKAFTIGD